MDHINITQACIHCLRGKKLFRVDLDLYDAEGRLMVVGTEKMKTFRFTCQFCWKESSLDFYKFSHKVNYIFYLIILKQYSKSRKVLSPVKNCLIFFPFCLVKIKKKSVIALL